MIKPTTAAEIAKSLGGRRSGSEWVVRCPAHEDRNPSLSLRDGNEGQVLVKCHAGCEQAAVIAALKARGLWPERERQPDRIIATYDYCDEAGQLLYQVVRTEPKGFFQRRPDGCDGWIYKKSERQVLYRLREVLEAPIVFVLEGEKDVDTLRSHGFVATTNAGGANAPWLPEYTDALRGKEVILIPDRDPPGRQRVIRIARALLRNVARLSVLDLEEAKDVTEWFERGHASVN